ncbi:MAG TPA: glycosyltransferase family 2 protein [Rudaea sp.]
MLAVLIINYRTLAATQSCIAALSAQLGDAETMYLLDNDSGPEELAALTRFLRAHPNVTLVANDRNAGYAGGMNLLIQRALDDPRIDEVLLLNSDTRPLAGFLPAMRRRVDSARRTEMVGARLLGEDGSVDSLGIALYRSTLASNRKRAEEVMLGPTGGCALFTRRLLEDLRRQHGEWFDESFFCYAEDTDLVLRARWLGYGSAYADDAVVEHAGSLSSGGPENDFVLYHGIRNSLWWLVKDAPAGWFIRSLPWFLLLHAGICVRHLRRGRARVLWRLYRDAIRGIPAMRRKRAVIKATRRVPPSEFRSWVEPHFYERDYLRRAWRELWRPRRRADPNG